MYFLCLKLQQDQVEKYITKYLVYSLLWAMSGDGRLKIRKDMGQFIRGITTIPLPPPTPLNIIDYEVSLNL